MIESMTGYGRSEGSYRDLTIVAELRSTNHKYCDITVRLPKLLLPLETVLRKQVQQRFTRGRLEVAVSINGANEQPKQLDVDLELARQYSRILKDLKAKLDLPGPVDLALLMNFKDIITTAEWTGTTDALAAQVRGLLNEAMDRLEAMRRKEGRALVRDLGQRLRLIEKALRHIQSRVPAMVRGYQARLNERIERLTQGVKLDPARLAQEVAVFAERSDVSEELTRLKSHLNQFRTMMQGRESIGRSLDFLIQEMNREVNTIGSKASDASIAMKVVGIKSELEKLREQVQNIE
ncbi:MAG TPA: YicC/YloC family endoribonuclease [Nitrospiria bacterium]|nr:YicC/YloC family endoribonuclease [Nitrospiria bacterium]